MNTRNRNSQDMFIRVVGFAAEHPEVLNDAAKALIPMIVQTIADVNRLSATQFGGGKRSKGGVEERRKVAKALRQALRDIAETGRVFRDAGNAQLGAQLSLPKNASYSNLLAAGESFAKVLTAPTVKTLFTARGYADSFVADLEGLVAKFRKATDQKAGGLNDQVTGTRGLPAAVRQGVQRVRSLSAILKPLLRPMDQGLYEGWKEASQIARTPTRKKGAATPPTVPVMPVPATGGSTPTTGAVPVSMPAATATAGTMH